MQRRTQFPVVLLAIVAVLLSARGDALSATTITLPADFADELVASVSNPTALAFTPDGRMLITQQPGQLRVYQSGSLLSTPALDLNTHPTDICTTSERGLLGVEVDPNFTANNYIYLYWSPGTSGSCKNRLSRFTMTGNTVSLGSELILVNNIPAPFGTHNAGDVHVGKDGHLYVSVGDGGSDYAGDSGSGTNNDAARDMHALVGKILRITRDGGIPADNPFVGPGTVRCNTTGTTTAPNKCQEIYATGLRNPFRIAFDPNAPGVKFHINDVGQNHWEEIDLGTAGADYGWNVREGPCVRGSTSNCGSPPAGMTNPIFSYQQGSPSGCRAITGGAFVPDGIWPAAYTGSYLFADYVCGRIFKLDQSGGTYARTDFATALGSNSAVHLKFGPHGASQALYYTTYEDSGSVRKIVYTGSANRVPTAALSANPTSGPAPLTVNFNGSGSSDPDGDDLTYLWDFGNGQTASGSSSTTSHTYTSSGTFTASLRVRDEHGATSTAAAVQIQSGNTAPTPLIETPSSTAKFRVGETVVLHGSATDAQDGTLGANRLSWRVLRHHGTSHTHPWLSDTTGNDIPISTPAPEDLATSATSFLEVRLTATDSQGLSTTVTREFRPNLVDLTFATQPAGLELEVNGEQVTAPFTFSSWEAWQFPVTARRQQDGSGATWVFDHWSDGGAATHSVTTGTAPATYTATFRPNAAPVATASSVSTPEDTARTVTLGATDPDGDAMTFAIERTPAMGALGTLVGSSVTYTPATNANGADSFDFSASDGAAASPDTTVSIAVTEVNDAPNAVDDTTTVAEDGSVLVDVRVNDSKGPANESTQTLAVSSVGTPSHGTAAIEGGSVRYTPPANYSGPASFGYQACDNGTTAGSPAPLCDTATVGVTVSPVNDAPVAVDDTALIAEDGGSVLVNVRANDTDLDGNPLSLTAVTPGAQTNGVVAIEAGSARYTPAANFNGQGRFDYTISDGAGGTDSGTVVVSVTPVNDAPVAVDDTATVAEDGSVLVDVRANDTDLEGNPIAVTATIPGGQTNGAVVLESGQVRYTPAQDFNGQGRFDYTAADGAGGTDTGSVVVTVTPVNDAPVAVDDSASASQGESILVDVLANDSAGPPNEVGQVISLSSVGTPSQGTAAIEAGKIRYTPPAGYTGPASFTYTACDDGAGAPCDTGTVSVSVGNAAPVASDLAASASEDAEVAIELAATDANGDALSFQLVSSPSHGTISSLSERTARYLPAPNYHGPDAFTFRATDGLLTSNVATVSVSVHEVNDPPTAGHDTVLTATDIALTIDVLANDSTGPPDEAGQRLTLAGVGAPVHGTTSVSGGLVVYVPSRTHNGPDSFAYTVCDDGRSGGSTDPRCATGTVDFAFSAFAAPRNVAAPRVVGGTRAGTLARAEIGTWDTPLLDTDFTWQRCSASGVACVAIRAVTGEEYRARLADVGKTLRVVVTARNRFGSGSATSAPGRPVATPVELGAVRHRGDDWVLLRNRTQTTVPLAGWSVSDAAGLAHRFRGGTIGPLRTLRVDTRDVFGARDVATLRLPGGRIADTCAYRARRAVAAC